MRTKQPTLAIHGPILLPLVGGTWSTLPEIRQLVQVPEDLGFRDTRDFPPEGGPSHAFEVVVSQAGNGSEFMERNGRQVSGTEADSAYEELRSWAMGSDELVRRAHAGEFVVARLTCQEFVAADRWTLGVTWHEWLDQYDSETSLVGAAADVIHEDEDSLALVFGSLVYLQRLEVHPRFRGQRIGLRLIGHTLLSLSRAEGDTAVMLVRPVESSFDPDENAKPTRRAARRLVNYYRRIGFEYVYPEPFRDELVVLAARFGERGLRFSDWRRG